MHEGSLQRMAEFVELLNPETKLSILDVGSADVNGTYRHLFECPNWSYSGLDLAAGKNVDLVAKGPYDWNLTRQYDVVISGQCLEHVEDVKRWGESVRDAVRNDGIVCVIAPWACNFHRYPIDCWRVMPDGMKWLLSQVVHFEVKQVFLAGEEVGDCVGVAHGRPMREELVKTRIPVRMTVPGKWVCSVHSA